jgi:hypothetical protein
MKKITYGAAVLLVAGTVTACTATPVTVTTTPAKTTGAAAVVRKPAAHVGDSITIHGQKPGNQITVQLVKTGPTTATDQFSTPPAGDEFYAVQMRITNTGAGVWQDAVDNDVTVQDGQGQTFQTDYVSSIAAGPTFPSMVTVPPGGVALGWVTLDVPTGAVPVSLQFALSSGFGNAARWAIP